MRAVIPGSDVDGRTLRRTRNRDAVLEAVVAIFEEGDLDPAIDQVAERAQVSNRSIYRYFDDRDHLIRAAMAHVMKRVGPEMVLTDVGVGTFDDRVSRFVDHRLTMYVELAPITRAARLAARTEPLIAEQFAAGALVLHQQFLDHFASEFDLIDSGPIDSGAIDSAGVASGAVDPDRVQRRTRAEIAAELPFQFESLEYLWDATNGALAEMRAVLVDLLVVCLGRLLAAPE